MDPSSHTFDYKDLAVSVATNNETGYQLTMSTASTSLINTVDNTLTIPTLDTLSGGYTTSTFQTNKWGYSKDSGNYFPFPTSELLLQNTTATNGDNTDLRFATKIDYTQPSGTYKTTISFNAIVNPPIYMQDVTPSMCTTTSNTVVDKRDSKSYAIKKLADGNCWMVRNLNFTGSSSDPAGTMTLSTETSNVQKDITISYTDLTDGNSYDQARIHSSGNSINGVWYNYAAATAMNVTGSSNTVNAASDICPRGWRLPTNTEQSNIVSYVTDFDPVDGGFYYNQIPNGLTYGYWWPSTSYNATGRYSMRYNEGQMNTLYSNRGNGFYVRCILDTRTLSDITYMQEMTPTIAANTATGATKNLTDTRDSKTYSVKKIGSDIWMTQNLAIGCSGNNRVTKTLSSSDSDIASGYSWSTGSAYSLDKTDNTTACNASDTADCNSYTTARMKCSSTNGAWYNYVAATAGTIKTSSNSTDAAYSICPIGWQLPSHTDGVNIIPYHSQFFPITGGTYSVGVINSTGRGYWWLSTASNSTQRYYLAYDLASDNAYSTTAERGLGDYVRCIAK